MSLRHAILGLLTDGPVHGYQLKSAFQRDLSPTDSLNIGQVYTTLDRLNREGLVGHQRVEQSERPDKKVYSLTDAGRTELEEWLRTPASVELDLRNETYLKLMLARRLDWISPREVIHVERRACLVRLHEITQARAKAERERAPTQTRLLLELAVLRLEAFIKWLDRCEVVLGSEAESE